MTKHPRVGHGPDIGICIFIWLLPHDAVQHRKTSPLQLCASKIDVYASAADDERHRTTLCTVCEWVSSRKWSTAL